jgi:crotonobetaine/carnitine-CoA ligase
MNVRFTSVAAPKRSEVEPMGATLAERQFAGWSVGRLLATKTACHPERTFLAFENQRFSYQEMFDRARCFAGGFERIGVRKDDTVCLMLPNSPEWIFAWFGLALLGSVNVGVNTEYRGEGLVHLLNISRARVLLLDEAFVEPLAEVADELSFLETVVYRASAQPLPPALQRFEVAPFEQLELAAPAEPALQVSYTDPLMLIFTSGTTGPAKAVSVSHNFALDFATEFVRNLGYREDDVLYTCFPLFHAGAALETVMGALTLGATVGLDRKFSASRFWDGVRRTGGTVFTCLGSVMTILWKQPPRADDAENPVRQVVSAPRPAFVAQFEERFGLRAVDCYGATEFGHPAFDPIDGEHRDGYVGRLVGHHDVMIADENDNPVPPNELGQILVRPRGPAEMMTEYFGNGEATVAAWRNLWYHTGDLGRLSEDGWLAFHGRMGDRLRIRGHNVSAQEIEGVIEQHEAVLECAVIGVPSDLTEDELKCLVIVRPNRELTAADLAQWCEGRLARYMLPRYVEFVPDLPRGPTHKVKKALLRRQWKTEATVDVSEYTRVKAANQPTNTKEFD